ncbi:molybdopterin-dependent oxidoreductase [Desulfitobacterium hafniense]|uniref:Molybdopterin oxidoreductase, DmsA-like n=4 Tax=Desulfitobacterium hafniense TaxID=49338 RepID=A0A098B445_DESHA|nr:molybdopterin-dependent oxidoreductase [Desulfitobacterium hafniense]ACL19996.1 molybdopterin oxidoreductase [Desulfitobacterium hafniense DCB-2]BAE85255.1 putative anaerobic DMSO reductase chain A precursor [Desulfitobacterium hafniense Y51]CDX03653.1 Molybdopterin oxidoreductase, DmsA-like [Desulfitobacterium hafniense]
MDLIDRITNAKLSRRSFILASAAATAGLSLTGCGSSLTQATADQAAGKEGKWITAACWHNCGGRCLNKAYVVDGVVIRQKTDDTHPDSPDYPQQRACVRGRSQRQQVFGADRLKYPMKRKNWEPGGGKKELRGRDEWVRISWDEALDSIAGEIKRIKSEQGNRAFFADGGPAAKVLALYGGYVANWGTTSLGSWTYTPGPVGFSSSSGDSINDRLDMRNCDTVIMFNMNPAWSSAGNPVYHFLQVKKAGADFIAIDPFYNDSYGLLEADWIPTRPATDTALMIGVAHTLIVEDDPVKNPLIDWDFLKKYTIGFDADSMPPGTDAKDNFKDYVLGTYDGVPKNAEWAAEISGVAPDRIRYLARAMNKNKKVALLYAWSAGRTQNADNLPQMAMILGAMTGHMGKSGHMCGVSCHSGAANGGDTLVSPGKNGLPTVDNPVKDSINHTEMWRAIVDGKYNFTGNKKFLKGEMRDIDIRLIYHDNNARLQSADGMTKGIEAHRKVDLVVSHGQFLTTNAKYSDFVLPVTTEWEKIGGFLTGNREMLIMYSQITEPLYEAQSDEWIARELAKRLGVDASKAFPIDAKQQFFNQIAGSTVILPDGKTAAPLVTITAEDIAQWGVQGKPQQGQISLKEFQEKGLYQIERKPGDNYGYIAFKDFCDDPEANPRPSASGKFEFYSQVLADTVNAMGYSEIKPIPTHIPPVEGYEATFKDWQGKIKGDYPYQVINPHYLRRSHTVFDNVQWLRETWPNPVYISTQDAKEKGLADGDTVLLTSQHGKTLRTACLTDRFMPGVIGLPHGSWVDMDEKTGIDTGGADNILCGPVSTGQGVSGWNSCVCNMEKYSGASLIADVQKPQRIIL